MSTDNPPAVSTSRLRLALSDPGAIVKRQQDEPLTKWQVRAILSSGILRDADEIRREAQEQGQGEGYLAMRAEYERHHHLPTEARLAIFRHIDLKAAIEALCGATGPERVEVEFVSVAAIRALLADDGAAALREHDAKLREQVAQDLKAAAPWKDARIDVPEAQRVVRAGLVYRDTAGACDCGSFDGGHPGDCAMFRKEAGE